MFETELEHIPWDISMINASENPTKSENIDVVLIDSDKPLYLTKQDLVDMLQELSS